MRISSIEEYGLRCLISLALQGDDKQLTIPEIAQKEGLSEPYVGKILSLLKRGKLIKAVRGRNGGFSLARDPKEITLLEAVTTLGGPLIEHDHCNKYTGLLEKCVHFDCCSVRYVLGGLIEYIGEFLSKTTLSDVMKDHELNNKEWLAGISKSYNSTSNTPVAGIAKQSEFDI
jgi:Rrf2 family protein